MAFESVKRRLRRDPHRARAAGLYADCVAQARWPVFYAELGVPDTMAGRFDLIVLHVFLVVRHLRREGERDPLAQGVFDALIRDLDDTYREEGYGDSKVARLVRGGAEQFYGRAFAYEAALGNADLDALAEALARNVFSDEAADAKPLARYASRVDAALNEAALRDGRAGFPDVKETIDAAS